MPKFIKLLFCKITPEQQATCELAEARLVLLSAYTAKEHADSVITFRNAQISRLTRFIAPKE